MNVFDHMIHIICKKVNMALTNGLTGQAPLLSD